MESVEMMIKDLEAISIPDEYVETIAVSLVLEKGWDKVCGTYDGKESKIVRVVDL